MISIKDLHKSFGKKTIYSGLNLEVAEGETHVIIGRSGEGKSVLLKHICGLLWPDKGDVIVAGRRLDFADAESVRYARSKVSMVFQSAALFDSLDVRRNVGFALDEQGRPRVEVDRLVEELLEEVNLPQTGHLYPAELSGGMRKRVGLARALVMEPQIILYDEPTTGLDPVTSDVINDLILATAHKHRVTSIVVTHDMKSAYKVGDRISMLYQGEIIFTGTPDVVMRSNDPIVYQFVNGLADGPITRQDDERVSKQVELRRIELTGPPTTPPTAGKQ